MKKLQLLLFVLAISLCASSCIILEPGRPPGGYRHGYGYGYKWRHHHKRGHHYFTHRCSFYKRERR